NGAEIEETSFIRYLDILSWLGFKTIQDIEDMRKAYEDDAFKLALRQLGGTDIDIVASTIGLQNLCIIYILKKGGDVVGLNMFFDLLHGQLERNKKTAERTFKQAKEINII
ncbi:MAG: hypothetical protein MJ072_00735, partial [Clostridia bacterium]|nr:hypothetical protein [Clostridia bacterium]